MFACVLCLTLCSSFEPFFLFSSSRHKKSDYSCARDAFYSELEDEEVKEEEAHQK